MVSKRETTRLEVEAAYWSEIEQYLPFKLMGWTYKHSATFLTKGQWSNDYQDTLILTGTQYNDIMNVVRNKNG